MIQSNGKKGLQVSQSKFYARLNENDGLLKNQLEFLGYEALWDFLSRKKGSYKTYSKKINALISIRNTWVAHGPENKMALAGRALDKDRDKDEKVLRQPGRGVQGFKEASNKIRS